MIDLTKLQDKIDRVLDEESPRTLKRWFYQNRNKSFRIEMCVSRMQQVVKGKHWDTFPPCQHTYTHFQLY